MTVHELREKLAKYPDGCKIVLDVSRDYEEYGEAECIIPCKCGFGPCGMSVERNARKFNAVLLT